MGEYDSLRRGECTFTAAATQGVYGFACWWRAELVPGLWLSTSPLDAPTHWEQIHFPVREPLVMAPGDVNLTFKRYLTDAVRLTIENDYVTAIDGEGADADASDEVRS